MDRRVFVFAALLVFSACAKQPPKSEDILSTGSGHKFTLRFADVVTGPISIKADFPNPNPDYAYTNDGPTAWPCDTIAFNPGKSPTSLPNTNGGPQIAVTSEDPIQLSGGYVLHPYKLSCNSYVLEVTNNEKRHALYTGVHQWRVSGDGTSLALEGITQKDGIWRNELRLINIASKTFRNIPIVPCSSMFAYDPWSGNRFVTYGSSVDFNTEICTWDSQGKNLAHITVSQEKTLWPPMIAAVDIKKIGYINDSSDIFYVVLPRRYIAGYETANPDADPGKNAVTIINTRRPTQKVVGYFNAITPQKHALDFQFDFSSFTFEKPIVRYRLAEFMLMDNGQEGFAQDSWSDWKEISVWE